MIGARCFAGRVDCVAERGSCVAKLFDCVAAKRTREIFLGDAFAIRAECF